MKKEPSLNILIIEDDKYARIHLKEILTSFGTVEEAQDYLIGKNKILQGHYDLVITDIELGNGCGSDLIPLISKRGFHCIVVSSFESDEIIEKAYSMGAQHYLSKQKIRENLPAYLFKIIQNQSKRFEEFITNEFITQDPELIEELKYLCSINLKGKNLFISGPTGSGKSLLGKLLHRYNNPEAPFVHLNCSEIPDSLIESELFGHEKGAFTGADSKKDGKLKLANGGTLFLDEIATMSLSMQQKLLKAIDEKTFYPVGSSTPIKIDFTLISATCEDVEDKISQKLFREDLYYRLNGFSIHLKPLCERKGDIGPLIQNLRKKSNRRFIIRPDALEYLTNYTWPGNVRELIKAIEVMAQTENGIITTHFLRRLLQTKAKDNHPTAINDQSNYIREYGLRALINQIEKKAVEESLRRNEGKITACIKELRISSSAFYRILQEHQLSI